MIRGTMTGLRIAWHNHRPGASRMNLRVLPVIALIAIHTIAPAGGRSPGNAPRDACLEDYKRLCSSVSRGGGRIRKCMTDNSDKLSPQCQAALAARAKTN